MKAVQPLLLSIDPTVQYATSYLLIEPIGWPSLFKFWRNFVGHLLTIYQAHSLLCLPIDIGQNLMKITNSLQCVRLSTSSERWILTGSDQFLADQPRDKASGPTTMGVGGRSIPFHQASVRRQAQPYTPYQLRSLPAGRFYRHSHRLQRCRLLRCAYRLFQ